VSPWTEICHTRYIPQCYLPRGVELKPPSNIGTVSVSCGRHAEGPVFLSPRSQNINVKWVTTICFHVLSNSSFADSHYYFPLLGYGKGKCKVVSVLNKVPRN